MEMKSDGTEDAARQALLDMQRYLADEIAPLMAADSARVLLCVSPKYGAAAIRNWVEAQLSAPSEAVPVSSYLYHAVKKFQQFTELQLIEPRSMQQYLSELSQYVVQLCPGHERAELKLKLSRLGEVETTLSAPVKYLNRELGTETEEHQIKEALRRREEAAEAQEPGAPPAASPRLSVMMDRLENLHQGDGKLDTHDAKELLARTMTKAAIESDDAKQFDAFMDGLRERGVEPKLDQVFRLLARRLPGWGVDLDQAGGAPTGRLIEAMHRIVSLAGTREEGSQRFSGMVYAAIEQFNEGHLAQAVSMFDLAARLIEEKKVDRELADTVRARAESSVSLGALRKFSSSIAKHGLLRKVLWFFPAFRPEALLKRLNGEPKRDVRRLILGLMEVHGTPCREAVLNGLADCLSRAIPDNEGFYSRNLMFLLRRIPRSDDSDDDREFRMLTELSLPDRPWMVVKEAIGALAQSQTAKNEKVLMERLTAFENQALAAGESGQGSNELLDLLDRTCDALARLGRRDGVRRVVHHGFREEPALGDTMARLDHLSGCDLANDPEQHDMLVDTLRGTLPGKLLGMVFKRKSWQVSHLVRALSGTKSPAVRGLFEEIIKRFSGQPFSDLAEEALAKFDVGRAPTEAPAKEGLSGDLDVFGLPSLLQSFGDAEQSGRLVISDRNGTDRATVHFSNGRIAGCEVGRLRGMDAVCQLFERPQPGTFRFEKAASDAPQPGEEEELEVVPTILEAMRRHDEFQEDRALVPDGASLAPTGITANAPPDEKDVELVRAVWREAKRGTAPESCEGAVGRDAYRVRRLYAHWMEQGALKLRPTA